MAKNSNAAKSGAAKKARAYAAAITKLKVFPRISTGILVVTLIAAFLPWLCIYNTDIPGIEIKVSGFAAFFCGLTGNLTVPGGLYGNMDTFNYFAPDACKSLALYGLLAYALVFALVIVNVVLLTNRAQVLHCVGAVLGVGAAVCSVLGFLAANAVNNSDIIATYCSGNPACSVESYTLFTTALLAAATVFHIIAAVRYLKVQALRK